MYPGNTPVEPGNTRKIPSSLRNVPENIGKILENLFEIVLRRAPGASRIGPGPFRNAPERRKFKKLKNVSYKLSRTFDGTGFGAILGPGRDPKIDQKRSPGRKSASGECAGSDFVRFLALLSFGVTLRTNF